MANKDMRPARPVFSLPLNATDRHAVLSYVLDFVAYPLAQNEILFFADIPAGVEVKKITPRILTVEGAAATFDVGDYSDVSTPIDADGFVDGADANSLGWVNNVPALAEGAPNTVVPAYGLGGKLYTAAAILGLTTPTAAGMDAAKIQIDVEVVRHGDVL